MVFLANFFASNLANSANSSSFVNICPQDATLLGSSFCFLVIATFLIQGVFIPRAAAGPSKDEDFGIWNTYDVEKN